MARTTSAPESSHDQSTSGPAHRVLSLGPGPVRLPSREGQPLRLEAHRRVLQPDVVALLPLTRMGTARSLTCGGVRSREVHFGAAARACSPGVHPTIRRLPHRQLPRGTSPPAGFSPDPRAVRVLLCAARPLNERCATVVVGLTSGREPPLNADSGGSNSVGRVSASQAKGHRPPLFPPTPTPGALAAARWLRPG